MSQRIKYPINYFLGAFGVKAFPKTQYDKIVEVVNAINPSGLTVTQTPLITSGVTLNAYDGRITTVSSTLAVDASASITLTNSSILPTSIITFACMTSGNGVPIATLVSKTTGSCVLKLTNVAGAAFNSTIEIGFQVK